MNWRQKLLDKWPYKVAALALAMLLWVNVTDDELLEQPVRTRVTYDVQDENYVLVEAPEEIRTSFRGRRADLVSLNFDPPTIRVTVEEVTDSVMNVDVQVSAVSFTTGTGILPMRVSPSTLTLRFEPVSRKMLHVMPAAQLEAAEGFIIVSGPIVEPDSVEASGPASQLDPLQSLSTEAVDLAPLRTSLQREVPVRISPDLEDVSVEPTTVLMRVEVDSLVEREWLVAVRVQGSAANAVSVMTDSVRVRLEGPQGEVAALSRDDLSASVRVNLPPTQPVTVPVDIALPEGSRVTATAIGPEVVVRRRSADSDS